MTPDDDVEQALARVRNDRMAATPDDIEALVETMRHEYTPEARQLRDTHALLDEYEAVVHELARQRRDLIDALIGQGWAQVEVAAMLGITRSRISQLTRKDDPN